LSPAKVESLLCRASLLRRDNSCLGSMSRAHPFASMSRADAPPSSGSSKLLRSLLLLSPASSSLVVLLRLGVPWRGVVERAVPPLLSSVSRRLEPLRPVRPLLSSVSRRLEPLRLLARLGSLITISLVLTRLGVLGREEETAASAKSCTGVLLLLSSCFLWAALSAVAAGAWFRGDVATCLVGCSLSQGARSCVVEVAIMGGYILSRSFACVPVAQGGHLSGLPYWCNVKAQTSSRSWTFRTGIGGVPVGQGGWTATPLLLGVHAPACPVNGTRICVPAGSSPALWMAAFSREWPLLPSNADSVAQGGPRGRFSASCSYCFPFTCLFWQRTGPVLLLVGRVESLKSIDADISPAISFLISSALGGPLSQKTPLSACRGEPGRSLAPAACANLDSCQVFL